MPEITKRRVTMTSVVATTETDESGNSRTVTRTMQAVDYVRPDFLDAYLAQARRSWQAVEVSQEPDAGPAGYDGATYVPTELDHPLAGTYYPATECVGCTHAPEGASVADAQPITEES